MTDDLQGQIDHYNALISEGAPAHVHAKLSDVYRRMGRMDEAAGAARTGLAQHPGSLTVQEALGLCCLDMGESETAVRMLAPVVERLPENAVAAISLAIALARIDRLPDALNVLRRRLEKDPLDRKAMNLLRALETKGVQAIPPPPPRPAAAPPRPSTPAPKPESARPKPDSAAAPAAAPAPARPRPAEPPTDTSESPGAGVESMIGSEVSLPIADAPARAEMDYVIKSIADVFADLPASDGDAALLRLDGFFDETPRPLTPHVPDSDETTTLTMPDPAARTEAAPVPEAPTETAPIVNDAAQPAVEPNAEPQSADAPPAKVGFFRRLWRRLTGKGA